MLRTRMKTPRPPSCKSFLNMFYIQLFNVIICIYIFSSASSQSTKLGLYQIFLP